jgi:Tol biopolymer transport system component
MTTPSRIERNLPDILGELAAGPTPEYLDDVFGRTGRMRQRPGWTFPERWLPMTDIARFRAVTSAPPWRMIVLALVVIALLVAAALVYVGSQHRVPAPFGPARNGLIPYASNGDIYLGDPVSGASRVLVQTPENESGAVTSPDGTRVVFARDVPGTTLTDVYVVGIDGSGIRKITPKPMNHLTWGQWTPDGRRLALIHVVESAGQCPTTLCNLHQLDMVDAGGSGKIDTIATVEGLESVQFRPPDGRELLYRALVAGKWGLFAMAADGTNAHPVVPPTVPPEMDAAFVNAAYTPDGGRIFYDAYTSDASFGDPGCCQLFVVNADGTDSHQFVPNTGDTWDGEAAVSPDGRKVAFWHNLPDRTSHRVTVVNTDGTGQPTETGPALPGTAHWIWAPDSSAILMFPDGVDSGPAYLLDPGGGDYRTLSWMSTGDRLDWQRLALE